MRIAINKILALAVWCLVIVLTHSADALCQETDRSPFTVEFPELSTGRLENVKSYITRSDVNVVKFWMSDPAAETVEWNKIFVRINRQSANRTCAQMPALKAKVLKCDLNRFFGFRLNPKENLLEIEAESRDGKRYFASFIVVTDAVSARKQSTVPTTSLGSSGRKFAVVMGVSKYKYNDVGLGNLNYADADANSLYRWLVDKGGFMPDNVLLMTNEYVTLSAVRDSLGRFLTKATETDTVLFFFAGHGTPDPFNPTQLYYLLHDSTVSDLANTGLPMTELKKIIDRDLKSKRVIFMLDTCHSAGITGKKVVGLRSEKGGAGARDRGDTQIDERQLERVKVKNSVSQEAGKLLGLPGRAVFASSGINEASRESKLWGGGHGVFTWAILEGLNGKADFNADKVITSSELFRYVNDRVRTETKSKQNPQLFSNLGADLEIAVLK